MGTTRKNIKREEKDKANFFNHLWREGWVHLGSVIDVIREPVLVLDRDLRILFANEPFHSTFLVRKEDTEKKIIYELGNGEWNNPELRRLLQDILPKSTFFKGLQITADFPYVGRKVLLLNARKIHFKEETALKLRLPLPVILLAIEDITDMVDLAEMLAHKMSKEESININEKRKNRISQLGTYL